MNYDYLYTFNKNRYEQASARSLKYKSDLKVIEIENGYLLPARTSPERLIGFGGVLDSKLNFVDESSIISGGKSVNYPSTDNYEVYFGGGYSIEKQHINILDEEVVYLGYINNHWGHFLIDFSTRLWYTLVDGANRKYVFLVNENKQHHIIGNIKRFFQLLKIPLENIRFVNSITKCKKIIIPESSYVTNKYYSQEYLNMFDTVASNVNMQVLESQDKVYFTRSGYSKAKNTEIGEEILLNLFEKNGFKIVSPERCSLDEQIALIRNSEIVAGIIGTISHNMLFANGKQKTIILNKTFSLNIVQMDINMMKQLDVTYIDAYTALFPVTIGHGPFVLVYNEQLEKFLVDHNWNKPDNKFISCALVRSNLQKYEKMYRKLLKNKTKIEYGKDLRENNYYCPEHLEDYYEKYYLLTKPISKFEIFLGKMQKFKLIVGKITERLEDIYRQKFKEE